MVRDRAKVTINQVKWGFCLQQKLMTLNINALPFHQSYACFDQMVEAKIARFRCKLALYLSYLHIKFYDQIKGNPLNFSHIFRLACDQ